MEGGGRRAFRKEKGEGKKKGKQISNSRSDLYASLAGRGEGGKQVMVQEKKEGEKEGKGRKRAPAIAMKATFIQKIS